MSIGLKIGAIVGLETKWSRLGSGLGLGLGLEYDIG